MKYLLITFYSILSLKSYSQRELDKWTLFPFVEANYQSTFQISPGLRYMYLKDCPGCPAAGLEFQLGTDMNFEKNNYYNVRFEASAHLLLMAGFATQYWNTQEGNFFTLGPKTGLNFRVFELNYSYNFHLTSNNFSIGKNRFGLKIDLETIYYLIKNGS